MESWSWPWPWYSWGKVGYATTSTRKQRPAWRCRSRSTKTPDFLLLPFLPAGTCLQWVVHFEITDQNPYICYQLSLVWLQSHTWLGLGGLRTTFLLKRFSSKIIQNGVKLVIVDFQPIFVGFQAYLCIFKGWSNICME